MFYFLEGTAADAQATGGLLGGGMLLPLLLIQYRYGLYQSLSGSLVLNSRRGVFFASFTRTGTE